MIWRIWLLVIALCSLVSPRAHAEAESTLQSLSTLEQRAMARLLNQAEQNLKATLNWVATSVESDASSWSETHRDRLFELNSRTQRSVRVLMLQVERLGLSTAKETAQSFTTEYGAFSSALRDLHRVVVMKENPVLTLEQSQRSALQALAALESIRSDIPTRLDSR
jgi:hypothetical protein